MKKGKDKKSKKKSPKLLEESSLHIVEVVEQRPNEFEMPGVRIIYLSPFTQNAIGCIVGETITNDQPWVYIPKEKIEDNLDLHEESSEFLPIRYEVRKYPEPELLMGIDTALHDQQEEFFICLTTDAKDKVIQKIEDHQKEMRERLKKSIIKEPRPWECLGSNIEVDDGLIKNLRNLFEIEVQSRYPLYPNKVVFSERRVNATADGYVELLPGRYEPNFVHKRRVDSGTQAAPATITRDVQTNPLYPTNKFTQYQYEYVEPIMKPLDFSHLNTFFQLRIDDICDSIRVNGHINLHENDYIHLNKRELAPPVLEHREVCNLQDVTYCKGMKVSSICWHPLISGILAAAYIRTPFMYISNEERSLLTSEQMIHQKHLVLIWCYSDNLLPKLYLHADREVLDISFCPTNPNILVGGLANGQIVIWDITGRLQQVETRKLFTQKEERHSLIIHSMMHWMKFMNSESVVLPTAVSNVDFGHTSPLTDLMWLSSAQQITTNGKLNKDVHAPVIQFITCGTDGCVLIWDLNRIGKESSSKMTSARTNRLGSKPSALTLNVSPFSHLNKVLCPQYKLVAENPTNRLRLPLTNISLNTPKYLYSAINKETLHHIQERTYFELKGEIPFEFEPKFIVSSAIGFVGSCSFEGHDFDQGQRVNSETCKVTPFTTFHDGPVHCVKSPFFNDVFVSVGGRVFAIWNLNNPTIPLLWRKSKSRYIFAIWSMYNPSLVIIARIDSHLELWDLSQSNRRPTRIQKLSGNVFVDGFTEPSLVHVRKDTLAILDQAGAIKVYHFHDSFTRRHLELFDVIQRVFEVIEKRKQVLIEWRADWIARYTYHPSEEDGDADDKKLVHVDEESETERVAPVVKLTPEEAYNIRQEAFMYQTLLEKKKLNIVEIEQHKIPLQKLMDEDQERKKKLVKMLAQKETIFERQKHLAMKGVEYVKRQKITVELPPEQVTPTKCSYMTSYKEAEAGVLTYVYKNPFRYRFDWVGMLTNCKQNVLQASYEKAKLKNAKKKLRPSADQETVESTAELLTVITDNDSDDFIDEIQV